MCRALQRSVQLRLTLLLARPATEVQMDAANRLVSERLRLLVPVAAPERSPGGSQRLSAAVLANSQLRVLRFLRRVAGHQDAAGQFHHQQSDEQTAADRR